MINIINDPSMIKIQVTAYNDLPPPQTLSAVFNELGGSIGRGAGNSLVLPDPQRHISREHAAVFYRGDSFIIRDLGTAMPVYVNGKALGNGQETALAQGDEIRIGGYTMQVYRELLGSTQPNVAPLAVNADPLALFGKNTVSGLSDPFADLFSPAPKTADSLAPSLAKKPNIDRLAPSPSAHYIIPDDFDPFAAPHPAVASPLFGGHTSLPKDINIALGPKLKEPSIDELFNLQPSSATDQFGLLQPSYESPRAIAGGILDPLIAMGVVSPPKQATRPQRDDTPAIHQAFRAPELSVAPSLAVVAVDPPSASIGNAVAAHPNSASTSTTFDLVLSWENTDPDGVGEASNSIIVPSLKIDQPRVNAQKTALNESTPLVTTPPLSREGQVVPTLISTDKPSLSPALAAGEREALLRAFLTGAGVPELQVALTPELMTQLGQLLRVSTQGTLDLLVARTVSKRELRADMTIISARENNPLKFSPNVEVALTHLLVPQGRGFMPPLLAMKDAHDDLRSHQFGFMAGMRAALDGVLARLNPEQLEHRLRQKSMLDSLLSMHRKARLWDLFAEFYQDIASEAQEDFNALFGKEFLRAYEAQIAKLAREQKPHK